MTTLLARVYRRLCVGKMGLRKLLGPGNASKKDLIWDRVGSWIAGRVSEAAVVPPVA